jgi:hypothetical protein
VHQLHSKGGSIEQSRSSITIKLSKRALSEIPLVEDTDTIVSEVLDSDELNDGQEASEEIIFSEKETRFDVNKAIVALGKFLNSAKAFEDVAYERIVPTPPDDFGNIFFDILCKSSEKKQYIIDVFKVNMMEELTHNTANRIATASNLKLRVLVRSLTSEGFNVPDTILVPSSVSAKTIDEAVSSISVQKIEEPSPLVVQTIHSPIAKESIGSGALISEKKSNTKNETNTNNQNNNLDESAMAKEQNKNEKVRQEINILRIALEVTTKKYVNITWYEAGKCWSWNFRKKEHADKVFSYLEKHDATTNVERGGEQSLRFLRGFTAPIVEESAGSQTDGSKEKTAPSKTVKNSEPKKKADGKKAAAKKVAPTGKAEKNKKTKLAFGFSKATPTNMIFDQMSALQGELLARVTAAEEVATQVAEVPIETGYSAKEIFEKFSAISNDPSYVTMFTKGKNPATSFKLKDIKLMFPPKE